MSRALQMPSQPIIVEQTVQVEAYTVDEFCEAHRIGKATLYALVRAGKGPKIMRFGTSDVRIPREAAAAWRQDMMSEWVINESRSQPVRQHLSGGQRLPILPRA